MEAAGRGAEQIVSETRKASAWRDSAGSVVFVSREFKTLFWRRGKQKTGPVVKRLGAEMHYPSARMSVETIADMNGCKRLPCMGLISRRPSFPPERTERARRGVLRLSPPLKETVMKARRIDARAEVAAYPIGWTPMLNAGLELRSVRAGFAAMIRFCEGSRIMGWAFCVSLWVSSLLAIWMTRGWIGLFLSGHVLSAGTCLLKGLAKRAPARNVASRTVGEACGRVQSGPMGSAS